MAFYRRTTSGVIRGRLGGGFSLAYVPSAIIVDPDPVVPVPAGVLFTTTVENADTITSWADQELAFGQEFAPGDVPAGTRVRALIDNTAVPCQLSNRTVWTDGSLKYAKVRMLVPAIAAGGTKTITWERISGNWSSHDTALHPSPTAITSKVTLEYAFPSWKGRTSANVLTAERGPKTFNSNNMLASGNSAWIDPVMVGSVCCEWRASDLAMLANATKDTNFGCLLYARAWGGTAGNPKRIQFFFRTVQGWSTDIPTDEQGSRVSINLKVNGGTVRGTSISTAGWTDVNTWKGGFLTSAGTEGTMDWYDVATGSFVTPPKLVYRRNLTYGLKAKFTPPIDTSNPNMPLTASATSYLPGRRGPLRAEQDDVGDHAMLAWTTSKPMAWALAAHARGTAAQILSHQRYTRAAALGMGAMTSIGLHRTTRKIVSYIPPAKQTNQDVLGVSIYGTTPRKPAEAPQSLRFANGATEAEISNLDAAHFPQMAFPVAWMEGDQHFLDLAYHEVTLPGLFEPDSYGFFGTSNYVGGTAMPFGGISMKSQIRATSHCARPIGNAVGLGDPSDPHWVMARDYLNHWAEMVIRITLEEDSWRSTPTGSGLTRTDGRRFQDLKLCVPNNEPTYKIWMHTIGLGAMAYNYGISEFAKMREMAEWFAHAPTVMCGGWHNDSDPLMKPDPFEAVQYEQICMDGIASDNERRRFWKFGQWQAFFPNCTYKADGQTIVMETSPVGSASMLDGMIMTPSGPRGGEPHWVTDSTKVPGGITLGGIYYSVQSSGLTCKLATTPGGPPVTFTTPNGVDLAAGISRTAIFGVTPMRTADRYDGAATAYLVQIKSALDMVQHYVLPSDPRVLLARQKLANAKAGVSGSNNLSGPNAFDERGKTTVPLTLQSTSNFSNEFAAEFA